MNLKLRMTLCIMKLRAWRLARKKKTYKVYVDVGMNMICENRRSNGYLRLGGMKMYKPGSDVEFIEQLHNLKTAKDRLSKFKEQKRDHENQFKASDYQDIVIDKPVTDPKSHAVELFAMNREQAKISIDMEVRANNLSYADDVERFAEYFWPNYHARGANGLLKREVLARFKRMVKDHMFTKPIATKNELREEIKRIELAKTGDTVSVKDPALFNSISLEDLKKELGL